MHGRVREFLREHSLQGLALAYGRDGRVLFEAGHGFVDAAGKRRVTPASLFRIASVSKPITATAVMLAVEKGQLSLDSQVFGPQGLLGNPTGGRLPETVRAITVDHLLTHTSGGWANDKDDPMFRDPRLSQQDLIAWTLTNQKQTHPVGAHYAYSNFGYCLLGRVLEKVTRQPYEKHVQQQVLAPCGVTDMRIAGSTLAQRQPEEVMYLTPGKPGAAYGMNVARMDAHGGWIATAGDLVRFSSQIPRLLREESIRTMTAVGPAGGNYARGWSVNKIPNWWHNGSLPGTSSLLVHTRRGLCWAVLVNSRKDGLGAALDGLMWKLKDEVKGWA